MSTERGWRNRHVGINMLFLDGHVLPLRLKEAETHYFYGPSLGLPNPVPWWDIE